MLRPKDEALLQGWAIVENTTEHDWSDVRLTLVNGRPISFKMDLYRPLYVERPTVRPELFPGLRPQLHAQDLAAMEEQFRRAANAPRQGAFGGMGGMGGGMRGGMAGGMGGNMAGPANAGAGEKPNVASAAKPLDPGAGIQPVAQGVALGELFRYQIEEPVSISRQGSAMLPIVNDSIHCEKVSLYNRNVQARHPLNAVQLVNATKLHLMQGPLTVFDGGEYAGDARIEDLAPGSRRLVSYALDLDVEVSASIDTRPRTLVDGRFTRGVLEVRRREAREHDYTVKNSSDHVKKVLIEHPIETTWLLKSPEATEKTGGIYRFAVDAPPGKPVHLQVVEETIVSESVGIAAMIDAGVASIYLSAKEISPAVKAAIGQYLTKQAEVMRLVEKLQVVQHEISGIESQQSRIRQNMNELERNSDLYKRYVTKLNAQESELEQLQPELKKIAAEKEKIETELNRFIIDLNID